MRTPREKTTGIPTARVLVYVLAVVLSLATLLLRLAFGFAVGDRPLLIFFVLPILLAAYMGGIGPGLVSTAFSAVTVKLILFPVLAGLYGTKKVDNVQWIALIVCGVVISLLSEAFHRKKREGEESRNLQADAIDQLRRSEALLKMRLDLSELARQRGLDALMTAALDAAEELTGSRIGFFHFVDRDQENLTLQAWSTNTLANVCKAEGKGLHYPISQAGVWADCFYERAPVVHNDYASLPHRKGLPDGHAPVVRELAVPVAQGDLVVAILGVGNKPTNYTGDDVKVISELASLIMDLVDRSRAEDEIHRLNAGLERRVEERTAELAAANEELEGFAYAVSHDLRAPLRAMGGFSQALIEDYRDRLDAEARLNLDQIAIASRKMGDLIDGILQLSRVTRGELHRDEVDLSALAGRILDELARCEPSRSVSWQIEPGLTAEGDARMLEVALSNLLGNAWKYTDGSPAPAIRVYSDRENGTKIFCVADNGAGFDMAHTGKLFQPFQRLHRQDEFPGQGIGLATVQRIVHRHGGEIRATGAVGRGAIFRFSLAPSAAESKEVS